jgi:hypothetical protein
MALVLGAWIFGRVHDGWLGVPNAPFAMRSDVSAGPLALVAAGVLAALAVGLPALAARARPVVWATGLAIGALAARLAVNAAREPGTYGWTRTFDPHSAEGPLEYLAGRPALAYGPRVLLDRFAELVPALPVHVSGHPPGVLLVIDALGIRTAAQLATLTIGAGALVGPVTWLLARGLLGGDGPRARAAGALAALAPGAVLMGATSADALFATVAVAAAALLVARPPAARAAGAVLLALASLLNWALLAAGAFAVLWLLGREGLRAAVAWGLACAAALLAVHGGLALATGWDPVGTLRATHDAYRFGIAAQRPYAYWLFGSPAAWLAFSGLAVTLPWLAAAGRGRPEALALLGVVALAALSGFSKAETERIWLFLVPFACVAAAAVVPPRRLVVVLALCGLQAVAVELLFDTVW